MTAPLQSEGVVAIKADCLTKSFPGVRAVDGLSFDVRAGEIFGLVGPDGAGKTTTLRMLAGILPPDAGSATVAGCDVARDAERAKHSLSYMPQRSASMRISLSTRTFAFTPICSACARPNAIALVAVAHRCRHERVSHAAWPANSPAA